MSELTVEQAIENFTKATDDFNKKHNIETVGDYKKYQVDRFDLAVAHDIYAKRYFNDYESNESPGRIIILAIWELYKADRYNERFSDIAMLVDGNQTIEDFRSEIYP